MWIRNGTMAVIAVVALATVSLMAQDGAKQPDAGVERTPFNGELIVVSMKDAQYGNAMTNPRLERIGDVVFITGKGFDTGHAADWTVGATIRVPLDEVLHIAEFEKADNYRKAAVGNPRLGAQGEKRGDL